MSKLPPKPSFPHFAVFAPWREVLLLLPLLLAGCQNQSTEPAADPFQGLTLRVSAVGDPTILEAVRVQSGEWEQDHKATLDIQTASVEPSEAAQSAEILVFPGSQLGSLIDADALAVLPESIVRPTLSLTLPNEDDPDRGVRSDPLDFSDVVQPYREQVSKYGEDRYALPLGGTALVLAYRRDAFDREANKTAAEEAGVTLEPPQTWDQLDALARFFQNRDWDGDNEPEYGLALPLGTDPDRLGDALFLARAASLGQPLDQYDFLFDAETMTPRLDSPPFVEALEKLVALQQSGPPGMASFDAEKAREAFRAGRAALLIDRPERASQWTDPKAPVPVDVVPLPGSPRVYDPINKVWREPTETNQPSYLPVGGGWLVGISKSAQGTTFDASVSYLRSLAGPEVAQALVSDPAFPMLPVRASHLTLGLPDPRSALGVNSRAWGDAVLNTITAQRVIVGLRIPGALDYLEDLSRARLAAVAGEPASQSLQAAASAWSDRTAQLGPARQLWHYRRSLNKLSTTANPPPRTAPIVEHPAP